MLNPVTAFKFGVACGGVALAIVAVELVVLVASRHFLRMSQENEEAVLFVGRWMSAGFGARSVFYFCVAASQPAYVAIILTLGTAAAILTLHSLAAYYLFKSQQPCTS